MENSPGTSKYKLARAVFAFAILALFLYVVSPLVLPVTMGALFAVIFYPWQVRLEKRKLPRALVASLVTLSITIGFLLPMVFFAFVGSRAGIEKFRNLEIVKRGYEAGNNLNFYENLVNYPPVARIVKAITDWFPFETEEVISTAQDIARSVGVKLADLMASFFTHLPSTIIALVVVVVSIFFFLMDGRKSVEFVRKTSFFPAHQTERLIQAFGTMCRSVVLATVVSGVVQAVIFLLACLVAGTGNIAFIAFLVFLFSFVPFLGSTPITIGVAAYELASGNSGAAVFLAIVGVFVTMMDNFIRPMVLRGAGNLHPLLAFVAAFGGLQTIGITGVFLGPIIAGVFVVTVQILKQD